MKILLLFICVCHVLMLSGQAIEVVNTSSTFDKIKHNLEQITQKYIDKSLLMQEYPGDLEILESIYKPSVETSKYKQTFLDFRQADIAYNKSTAGLSLTGGYLHNVKGSILEEDGFFYLNRWQAGLNWDILKGGLLNEKSSNQINQVQYEIDSLQLTQDINLRLYGSVFDYIIYLFNGQKIQLVQRHQHLLDKELEVAYQLYYQKYIHWEEVLTLMSKKAEVDVALKNYINYNKKVELPFSFDATLLNRLPLVRIDYEHMKSIRCDTLLQEKITELAVKKDRLENNWKFKPNLSTYVRYNRYQNPSNEINQRDFIAGGIQFQIPIVSRKKDFINRIDAKEQWLKLKNQTFYATVRNELLNHYYEYEYMHGAFIDFYHKKLMAINQINRELSKKQLQDPGYSPLEITKHLDNLYQLDLEILDQQQRMYLKLLKILQFVSTEQWPSILYAEDITHLFTSYHETHKMRIEPVSFKEYSIDFILAYLQKNSIQNAIVPLDSYNRHVKNYQECEWSILLDAESIISQEVPLKELDASISSVYLDINPLNFKDFESNKSTYQELYLELAKNLSGKHKIEISLPLLLDETYVKILAKINNQITLKFSENNDPEKIITLINNLGLDPDIDVQLELGCDAFLDRFQMEEFIQLIKESTNVKSIVIHDFERLLTLESNTIQLYEKQRF